MYYRGAAAALVVYDITSYESFEQAKYWIKELENNSSETQITLCGNKIDMDLSPSGEEGGSGGDSLRRVPSSEAKLFCEQSNIAWVEVSAKTGANVKSAFDSIAINLIKTNNVNSVRQGGVVGPKERQRGEEGWML